MIIQLSEIIHCYRGKVYLQIIFDRISSIANIVEFGIFLISIERMEKNGVKRSNLVERKEKHRRRRKGKICL